MKGPVIGTTKPLFGTPKNHFLETTKTNFCFDKVTGLRCRLLFSEADRSNHQSSSPYKSERSFLARSLRYKAACVSHSLFSSADKTKKNGLQKMVFLKKRFCRKISWPRSQFFLLFFSFLYFRFSFFFFLPGVHYA